MEKAVYTDEWLEERCAYWQEVLRLQDWRIAVRFVHAYELSEGEETPAARVSMDRDPRHAVVRVVWPEEIDPHAEEIGVDPLVRDAEVLLVHELLHLSLALCDEAVPDDPPSIYEVGQEQHIQAMSRALVTLDRKSVRKTPR